MYLDPFEIVENCPHRKIPYFIKKWYETNFEGVNKEYTSATYIYMFEINPLKVVMIWFIKGSQIFLMPIKSDFFS